MIPRLVAGILAIVFLALGIPFLILGFVGEVEDADGFKSSGSAAFAAGLIAAAIFVALTRRAKAQQRRRTQTAQVEIVAARLNQYTRIGVMLTYDLTVRLADGRTFTRKVLVPPTTPLTPGGSAEIRYDPDDPGNFEVVTGG